MWLAPRLAGPDDLPGTGRRLLSILYLAAERLFSRIFFCLGSDRQHFSRPTDVADFFVIVREKS